MTEPIQSSASTGTASSSSGRRESRTRRAIAEHGELVGRRSGVGTALPTRFRVLS
ncbi:hypothetical protein ABZT27_31840 [Streptomyces sp. NPDC005389]|uniref:hypothetical protein n=1 Tax=Streptomyces sp. NPDC005389 TaxID=3157040 RepID=UPI0033AC8C00